MNTAGGTAAALIATARLRVASSRLSRSLFLVSVDQRFAASDSPDRLITASAASTTDAHGPLFPSAVQPTREMPGTPVPGS